jgi:hypothetical protein
LLFIDRPLSGEDKKKPDCFAVRLCYSLNWRKLTEIYSHNLKKTVAVIRAQRLSPKKINKSTMDRLAHPLIPNPNPLKILAVINRDVISVVQIWVFPVDKRCYRRTFLHPVNGYREPAPRNQRIPPMHLPSLLPQGVDWRTRALLNENRTLAIADDLAVKGLRILANVAHGSPCS